MEGLYKLLPAEQAHFGNLACLAGRRLYGPSLSYLLGFQTKCIWNSWGIPVYLAPLLLLYLSTLLDSWLAHCDSQKYSSTLNILHHSMFMSYKWSKKNHMIWDLEHLFQDIKLHYSKVENQKKVLIITHLGKEIWINCYDRQNHSNKNNNKNKHIPKV